MLLLTGFNLVIGKKPGPSHRAVGRESEANFLVSSFYLKFDNVMGPVAIPISVPIVSPCWRSDISTITPSVPVTRDCTHEPSSDFDFQVITTEQTETTKNTLY